MELVDLPVEIIKIIMGWCRPIDAMCLRAILRCVMSYEPLYGNDLYKVGNVFKLKKDRKTVTKLAEHGHDIPESRFMIPKFKGLCKGKHIKLARDMYEMLVGMGDFKINLLYTCVCFSGNESFIDHVACRYENYGILISSAARCGHTDLFIKYYDLAKEEAKQLSFKFAAIYNHLDIARYCLYRKINPSKKTIGSLIKDKGGRGLKNLMDAGLVTAAVVGIAEL